VPLVGFTQCRGGQHWCLGYVAPMDSDVAKGDTMPIIRCAIGGEIIGQYIYDGFIKLWWESSMKV